MTAELEELGKSIFINEAGSCKVAAGRSWRTDERAHPCKLHRHLYACIVVLYLCRCMYTAHMSAIGIHPSKDGSRYLL